VVVAEEEVGVAAAGTGVDAAAGSGVDAAAGTGVDAAAGTGVDVASSAERSRSLPHTMQLSPG